MAAARLEDVVADPSAVKQLPRLKDHTHTHMKINKDTPTQAYTRKHAHMYNI